VYISYIVYSAFKNDLPKPREAYRKVKNVGFAVLKTVTMKSTIFRNMKHRILVEVYQCSRGTNCLHFQRRRVGLAGMQHEDSACISPLQSDVHKMLRNFTPSRVIGPLT
jgi:hypothetical protein